MRTSTGPRRVITSDEIRFEALSVGIGIGGLRPLDSQRVRQAARPGPAVVNKATTIPAMPVQVIESPSNARNLPRAKGPGISVRLLAYGLDFFFVALTLGVALALATVLSAVRTGETENWLATKPIQWLAGLNPFAIVGAVYGAFIVYALLFKALAGKTVGESLLGVSRPKNSKPVKA